MRNTDLKENQKGNLFYRWRKDTKTHLKEWVKNSRETGSPRPCKKRETKKGRTVEEAQQSLYPKREGTRKMLTEQS